MKDPRKAAIDYAHTHQEEFLKALINLCKIPSISTDPERQGDILHAVEWIAEELKNIGVEHIQVFPTKKHPIVFGQYFASQSKAPTILIYGHYDVQPAEPLEHWKSKPFEPEIRGENLYARGASDMKGQVLASLKAVESVLNQGDVPVNLKFIIEGEEEIGSPSLGQFLTDHKDLLTGDVALNPDAGIISPELPSITYGLRGLAYFELQIFGPTHDLHSGLFGGVIHNPAIVLSELIAGMHDSQGRITLPGFYDKVRQITPTERLEYRRLPLNSDFYLNKTGAPALGGEQGYTPAEQISSRPTLEVNGILSGFTGAGSKTIIPSSAMAKISMRLVPDQNPDEVHQQLIQYLEQRAPNTIRWELKSMAGGPASFTDRNHPAVDALARAIETVWGVAPVYKRDGGSIPVVSEMQKILGVESVLTGFSLPDDNIHGPNEKLHLPTWYRGIDTLINFIYNLSEI